jgi:DNA-binding HxlR family transcriptional regulator
MERKSFSEMHCSVAQCLEAVGEWWSLLIVRDAFLGVTRFDEFQQRLGISRGVLNQRLVGSSMRACWRRCRTARARRGTTIA